MCSVHEARLTLEFKDHYVIRPSITFWDYKIDYKKNGLNETGKQVRENFEYNLIIMKTFKCFSNKKFIRLKII